MPILAFIVLFAACELILTLDWVLATVVLICYAVVMCIK